MIDVDANLLHGDLFESLEEHVREAKLLGVLHFIVPGLLLFKLFLILFS
jgi:hypothetical protein